MRIELYRTGNQWGYTVNGPTGGAMGFPYPYRWMAWIGAYQAASRVRRRDFRWEPKQ